ncbi:MAG: protoporphyrinogen oxidase [bacterium]
MKRLVVVGAGVSGLAAGWAARRVRDGGGEPFEILVLERAAQSGGKVRTIRRDGFLVEAGPTSYLDDSLALDALIRELGLAERRQAASRAAARRYLVLGGRLRELGGNPLQFFASGILSPWGIARLFAEPFVRPGGPETETLWEFGRRRLGREAADRLIAPMALGVVAGDARRLSAAATFPSIWELEREHGSLLRGMIAKMKARKRAREAGQPVTSGRLASFDEGMQALPRALAAVEGVTVRCGVDVRAVLRDRSGALAVRLAGETLPADAVIVATESHAAAELLQDTAPGVAARLAEIEVPPIAVVALGFDAAALPDLPAGFGALIPRPEGIRHLGSLWDSHIFAGRAPEGRVLLRLMFGGGVDPAAASLDDPSLLALAREELARYVTVSRPPVFQEIARWPRAIAQYDSAHLARRRDVDAGLARCGDVFLAGTSLAGVGVPRAVESGLAAGRLAAERLRRPSAVPVG